MALNNPYVGPRPLSAAEKIFGRGREIRELSYLLTAERIVLLHSPSGAGKSSLINARGGVLDRMRARFDVWAPTRVNLPPSLPVSNRYAWSAAAGFEQEVPKESRRPPEALAGLSLREAVHSRWRAPEASEFTLLVFDQFEEVLRIDPVNVDAKRSFFHQLGDLLLDPCTWALFVLREDFLAPLDPYCRLVSTHLQNRYRIDLLDTKAAREAMASTARLGDREFAADAAEKLVSDLAQVKVQEPDGTFTVRTGPYVEPVQLQVACRGLWDRLPESDRVIDMKDVREFGDVSEALSAYYGVSVGRIAGDDLSRQRAIRTWAGTELITAGIRGQVLRGPLRSGSLANEDIAELENAHLVRAEQRAGAVWYELAHDSLIEPVLKDNARWVEDHLSPVQKRADLWDKQGRGENLLAVGPDLEQVEAWAAQNSGKLTAAEQSFLEESRKRQKAIQREKRQVRLQRLLTFASVLFGLLAVAGLLYASRQAQIARERAAEAQRQKDEANRLRTTTLMAVARSAASAMEARRQSGIAEIATGELKQGRIARDQMILDLISNVLSFSLNSVLGGDAAPGEVRGSSAEWRPLVTDADHKAYVMARTYVASGGGRILVAGHDEFLIHRDEHHGNQLLQVALMWLSGDRPPKVLIADDGKVALRTMYGAKYQDTLQLLRNWRYRVEDITNLSDASALNSASVLIIPNFWRPVSQAEIAAVGNFVRDGGGVLAEGLGWSWQGYGKSPNWQWSKVPAPLDEYPMNRLMSQFGVHWLSGQLKR